MRPDQSGEVQRILPDGCLDIIVGPRSSIVVGTMTRALLVPARDGAACIGVRFRPGMATAFLRMAAASVTDGRAPLDALWSDARTVTGYVDALADPDRAVERFADVLVDRLSRTTPIPDDIQAAVVQITSRGGRVDVSRLAESLGVSRQHLARRFATYVGISPKTLCRVARLREVIRLADHPRAGWAALAADLGYYDQSHLVADFRSLTGLTPSRWAASRWSGSKFPRTQSKEVVSFG
jgi:AraC-like DNA-binding protein